MSQTPTPRLAGQVRPPLCPVRFCPPHPQFWIRIEASKRSHRFLWPTPSARLPGTPGWHWGSLRGEPGPQVEGARAAHTSWPPWAPVLQDSGLVESKNGSWGHQRVR